MIGLSGKSGRAPLQLLMLVHERIGARDELLHRRVGRRRHFDVPGAVGDGDRQRSRLVLVAHALLQPRQLRFGIRQVSGRQHHELVAADARDHVPGAERL